MNDKLVVIGSCNTDMVVKTERLPVPGETILGGSFMMNPGGKGANQAVAASRLGGKVTLVAKTGNDLFGRQSREVYEEEGIDTSYVFSDENNPSGVALISVDREGENCIVVASGANANLTPADIEQARDVIEKAAIVLMQLEIPLETVEYAAGIAHKKGVKVILNPAPAQFLPDQLLSKTDILVPNCTEARILSGIEVRDMASAREAADIIASKGVSKVVVTLGSKGAFVKDGNEYHEIEACKVCAVDTTAAGDTFCGTLAVVLAEGGTLVEAVRYACKTASICVTRVGAQCSVPYRYELEHILK